KAHDEAFKEFSKELGKKWPTKNEKADISTKVKFVEYGQDLNSKKVINYEKQNISLEVIAKNKQEAKQKIEKLFNELLNEDLETAYKKDVLEKKIAQKLNKKQKTIRSNQKLIADIISAQEKIDMRNKLKKQNLIIVKYKDKFIYKANVKLPSNSMIRKAKIFKTDVIKNANTQQIPAELIYAIIHSESSFNPMARSHIPAFGLMQIVPSSAGIDSYEYLYKKKRVLSSDYLYDPSKNITIGSGYLHILYYNYLKNITNPQSRLYCAIASYNTGAGNVAKTFIGNNNINEASNTINKMSPDQVYKQLLNDLPYNETRKYLKKVTDRVSSYNKLLQTTL
ncbi:MAG: membrane-bound lytic murein transglycosylase C, partial [Arcobacteraceae bacterium]